MINAIAQFETTLASGISKTSTTGVLLSNVTGDNDGATIPNGDYGVVIDERNSKREYAIITIAGFNFTFVKRGLSFIDGDTVKTGNQFDHRKGAVIKIVTHPLITLMVKAFNGELPFGGVPTLPTTRTISNPRSIVDKEYADSLVTSSIPSLAVLDNGGITININAGYFVLNGVLTYYAGIANQSLTNNATNYVQLKDGALSINTTGFENDAMPLAKVVTVSGDISLLQDARAILSWIDIKSGYGLSRDITGIFIDLEASGGLIFNAGKLKVDDIYAKLSGDQTINGVKSFGSIPVLPASDPTTANQAVRKSYVDSFSPTIKTGVFSKTLAVETVDQVITHNLGRIPKRIRIISLLNPSLSDGVYDGASYSLVARDASGNPYTRTTDIVDLYSDASGNEVATITAVSSTQMTLHWVGTSGVAGTARCYWEVS